MENQYKIEGTNYLNPPEEFLFNEFNTEFQKDMESFKLSILNSLKNNKPTTYYKFGDGDYYFLNKIPKGSAKPGRRALKKPYFLINHNKFVKGAKQNNYFMAQMPKMHQEMFFKVFNKSPDFYSEFTYGLLANKWLLKKTTKNIGLIGADKKLELIHSLIQKQEYQEYLGIEKFSNYVSIPQRFACDNLQKTIRIAKKQLTNSNTSLYLVGVGHVKSGLLHELKNFSNSVFLDVGVGIDALSGIVNLTRPYYGDWKNYQLQNSSIYKDIDFLVNKNNNIKNINYI